MDGDTRRPVGAVAVTVAAMLAVAGCTDGSERTDRVTVFAAASLTESFQAIADTFMQRNPAIDVTFNFAGSSALAQQITSGAPADVFAAASPATMRTVVGAGDAAGRPEVFARNRLEIVVPPDNPGKVTSLADFADPDLTIALCAPEVPCGEAAERALAAAGIAPAPDTLEQDVKAALGKVELGEADAALVYRTDAVAAGAGVRGIEFSEAETAVNDYLITTLTDAPNGAGARAFVEYVRSAEGRQVLADAGFDRP